MADENALTAAADESTFVITRTFDAPRDLALESVHGAGSHEALVGSEGIQSGCRKNGFAARRHLALWPARARRQTHVGRVRLSRNRPPGWNRPCLFLLRRSRHPHPPPDEPHLASRNVVDISLRRGAKPDDGHDQMGAPQCGC